MKHKTEICMNVHHAIIHLDTLISEKWCTSEYSISDNVSEEVKTVLKQMSEIPGVTKIGFDKYEVRVTKGDMFNWSDILPLVLQTIYRKFYNGIKLPEDYPFLSYVSWEGVTGPSIDELSYHETERQASERRAWEGMY